MKNSNKKQNKGIFFSEKDYEIIRNLVEKYKLEKEIEKEKEVKERLKGIESPLERAGIKFIFSKKIREQLKEGKSLDEILAFGKLRKIIRELKEKKISFKELSFLLQQNFNLSQKTSEMLAKEINQFFPFPVEKISAKEEVIPEKPPVIEEKKMPSRDIYREPIE